MDTNSVTNIPRLTLISKGKAVLPTLSSRKQPVQVTNIPRLTLISKRETVPPNLSSRKQPVQVTNVPRLTIISKGKAVAPTSASRKQFVQGKGAVRTSTSRKQLLQGGNIYRPRLTATLSTDKRLVLKKFAKISAPAPFFDACKSKIPKPAAALAIQQDSITDIETFMHADTTSDDFHADLYDTVNENGQNMNELIVETEDKTVQTECFCHCVSRSDDASINQLTREVAMLKVSVDNMKVNVTGRNVPNMIRGLFPIKSIRDLERIEHHMRNTENFQIRMRLFLKYLEPKMSNEITTAFKELVTDEFLLHFNWDGLKGQDALSMYEFFNTTLFDAWKNSVFTKDVYIDAMRSEIKKAHDRLTQRKRKRTGNI